MTRTALQPLCPTPPDQRALAARLVPRPASGSPSSAFRAQRRAHGTPAAHAFRPRPTARARPRDPAHTSTPLFPTAAHANPDAAASSSTPFTLQPHPPRLPMSCSAAAGAEATALLFRSAAPSTIVGRHRLAMSRRTSRRNLRWVAFIPECFRRSFVWKVLIMCSGYCM